MMFILLLFSVYLTLLQPRMEGFELCQVCNIV